MIAWRIFSFGEVLLVLASLNRALPVGGDPRRNPRVELYRLLSSVPVSRPRFVRRPGVLGRVEETSADRDVVVRPPGTWYFIGGVSLDLVTVGPTRRRARPRRPRQFGRRFLGGPSLLVPSSRRRPPSATRRSRLGDGFLVDLDFDCLDVVLGLVFLSATAASAGAARPPPLAALARVRLRSTRSGRALAGSHPPPSETAVACGACTISIVVAHLVHDHRT